MGVWAIMSKERIGAWVALALLTVSLGATAMADTPGVGAAAFLRRGVDARALAMGGAHVAVADGYSALYWNPAGLSRAESPLVGGMTSELFGAKIFLNYISGVYPWQLGTPEQLPTEPLVGGEGGPEDEADAPAWQLSTELESVRLAFAGSFTEMATEVHAFDERGNPIGLIRYSEAVYGLGAGAWVPGLGHAGVAGKAYYFVAPAAGVDGSDATAFGLGVDAGLVAPVWRGLWLGLSASDIGNSRIQWRNTLLEPTDKVAGRFTAGTAYYAHDLFFDDDRLIAALDGTWEPLVETRALRAGLEYTAGFLSLRGGATLRQDMPVSFSAGVGVQMMQLSIDAGWVQTTEFGSVNEGVGPTLVVSASFKF